MSVTFLISPQAAAAAAAQEVEVSLPLPSWPWTPAEHTLHMTHKAAARDFTAASRMFSHFNRMVSTAALLKSKVHAPTAPSF